MIKIYRVLILGQRAVTVEASYVKVAQDGSRVFWRGSGPRPVREDVDWEGMIVAIYPSSAIVELAAEEEEDGL